MNIAVVPGIFFPKPGGVQVQVHNIYNNIAKKNYKVDLFLFEKTDILNNQYNIKLFNRLVTSLVFILHYYLNINVSYLLSLYLKKIIKKNNYSIWHFHFINYKSLIFINCLKSLNQKIIVTFHGIDIQIDEEIGYGYRLNNKFQNYLLNSIKKIDHFTFISQTIKNDLLKLGIDEKKLSEVPNAIDLSRFNNKNKELKQKKKIRLITVARYDEKKKGYDLLPILSKKLIEKKIKFIWSVIGNRTFILKDHKIIKDNLDMFEIIDDIYKNNENYFPNEKLIKKYIDSDLYVNLSRIESFGVTFIESLAAQTPVITFDKKGANELVQNKINGFVIKGQNLDSMANKIYDVWKDFSLIESLKINSRKTIKKFDLNLVTKKLLNVYSFVCKKN
jgi:glycosyltransferase involved in cell wall biosynthesis